APTPNDPRWYERADRRERPVCRRSWRVPGRRFHSAAASLAPPCLLPGYWLATGRWRAPLFPPKYLLWRPSTWDRPPLSSPDLLATFRSASLESREKLR